VAIAAETVAINRLYAGSAKTRVCMLSGPRRTQAGSRLPEFRSDPTFATTIKQGETQSVAISLERGDAFKQEVSLEIKLAKGEGITFDPAGILIKAGDKPDVQLAIAVPKDAALGEYVIAVTGTPTTGEATSTEFNVKVVAP